MQTEVQLYICKGFNNFCPELTTHWLERFCCRTAVVVKKMHFKDNWGDRSDEFLDDCVLSIARGLRLVVRIGSFDEGELRWMSRDEFREWRERSSCRDPEFLLAPPDEVSFERDGSCVCRMSFEDWSDCCGRTPYALSYTFSFYSQSEMDDAIVDQCIRRTVRLSPCVNMLGEIYEAPAMRWYWKAMNMIRKVLRFRYNF